MTAPPGTLPVEVPIPADNPVSGSNLPHIPRRHIKDAIRVLHGDGFAVTGGEAYHLIRRWQRHKRVDASVFIRDEFGEWIRSNYWPSMRYGLYAKGEM